MKYDIAIINGIIVDGTGRDRYCANIGIKDGTIKVISSEPLEADTILDAAGKIVCPGFIDIHAHTDLRLFSRDPTRLREGITTEVVGNCGYSAFPIPDAQADRIRAFTRPLLGIWPSNKNWDSAESYIKALKEVSPLSDVLTFVGHGTLRIATCGERAYRTNITKKDIQTMCSLLTECLESAGVVGLSLGLEYPPSSYAGTRELIALASAVARHGGILAVHLRNQYERLAEAIDEVLSIARATGVKVEISHLQSCLTPNKVPIEIAIEKLELARKEGLQIGVDMYPYTSGSTVLNYLLPQWMLEGGVQSLLERIENPCERERAVKELRQSPKVPWKHVLLTGLPCEEGEEWSGLDMATLARQLDTSPEELLLDLLYKTKGAGTIVVFNKEEGDIVKVLAYEYTCVASDAVWGTGKPHPRYVGTFSRFLGHYVCRGGLMSLEEGIWRCTGLPAQRMGLRRQGRVEVGYDIDNLKDRATYENPTLPSTGIQWVLFHGELVPTGGSPGKQLRGTVMSGKDTARDHQKVKELRKDILFLVD